jgi:perosamine synthetase
MISAPERILIAGPSVVLNAEPKGAANSYWMVTAIIDSSYGMDKVALMAGSEERNIDARPFFTPLFEQPAFAARNVRKTLREGEQGGSQSRAAGINLPAGYPMTRAKVSLMCGALREILEQQKRRL